MRKFQFRAWDIKNKCYQDNTLLIRIAPWEDNTHLKDRFVLEQFTGLYDCTANEIYENDLIEFPENSYYSKFIGCVIFENGRFVAQNIETGSKWDLCSSLLTYFKVVGNIHYGMPHMVL